jgi:transposase
LLQEIAKAKRRFGLPADAAVVSCYEAGRDGFWLHRFLTAQGIGNVIVDASSIEVNRRARRAKTDRLDATKLVAMLVRYQAGERKLWSVVRVPSRADEDARQLHRELLALKRERTKHVNEVRGLLANQGLAVAKVDEALLEQLPQLRCWDGTALAADLQARLRRTLARWALVQRQIGELESLRQRRLRDDATPHVEPMRRLLELRGVGLNGSWLAVHEVFAWRAIQNRRQLASLAGLTPTPYQSGGSGKEQGISKAGNKRLRWMLVELAWQWLRWQPDSALAQWYQRRFGAGGSRQRKIGIVALARKLLVALWKYLAHGEVPAGAVERPWQLRVTGRVPKRKGQASGISTQ